MRKILFLLIILVGTLQSNANEFRSTEECVRFIKEKESFSPKAYWDGNGYSIGYGHHGKSVKRGDVISHKEALMRLRKDIKTAEFYVNHLIKKLPYKYKFSKGFIDGFTSFVYNVGVGNAQKSLFYKRLKKCRVINGYMNPSDFHHAITAIKVSCVRQKGHISRREGEYRLMKKFV